MACKPEEQNRLIVVAATDVGSPASIAATRATFCPCGPLGCAQPKTTSSISLGSSFGVLRSTSLMQCAASSSGRVKLKDPRNDFASAVRELATTTASLMLSPGQSNNEPLDQNGDSRLSSRGFPRYALTLCSLLNPAKVPPCSANCFKSGAGSQISPCCR